MNRKPNSMKALLRREFLATSSAVTSATLCLTDTLFAAPVGKRTFTILHTNDLHSNLLGVGPASEYTTTSLNDEDAVLKTADANHVSGFESLVFRFD